MEIRYALTEQDFIDFNLHHIKTSKIRKKNIFIQRLIGPTVFLLGIFVGHRVTDIPLWYWSIFFVIAGTIWFFLYPRRIKKAIRSQILKMLKESDNRGLLADQSLRVDEDGLNFSNEYSENKVKWNGFTRVDITDKHIFIFNSSVSAHIIPVSAFSTEEQKEEFYHLVSKQVTGEGE